MIDNKIIRITKNEKIPKFSWSSISDCKRRGEDSLANHLNILLNSCRKRSVYMRGGGSALASCCSSRILLKTCTD